MAITDDVTYWLVCVCMVLTDELQSPRAEFARDINYQPYNYWWGNGKKKENVKILWHSVHMPYSQFNLCQPFKQLNGRVALDGSRKKSRKGFEDLWFMKWEQDVYESKYTYGTLVQQHPHPHIHWLQEVFGTQVLFDVIERARAHTETHTPSNTISHPMLIYFNFKHDKF